MKVKHIAALASLGAILCSMAPAMAATGVVTVKWNTQKSAAITMYTQTTASQVHGAGSNIYWVGNGSSSSGCNGTTATASAGTDASANLTVNYGNVIPDGVDYTNCLEVNALEAYITTNDTAGVQVQAAITGTPVGYDTAVDGSLICILPNGTWNAGAATAWTASARAAAVAMSSTTACSSGTAITSTNATLLNSTVAATQDLNADMQLNLGPNSTTGAVTATLTYTVTPN
jgi:hypothetical protein